MNISNPIFYFVIFSEWLQRFPSDDTKARCAVCCATLQAHLKGLKTHGQTKKHQNNLRVINVRRQPSVMSILKEKELDPVKVNEVKLAIFISAHAPNLTVDHLGEMIKKFDSTAKNITEMRIHRTKCLRLQKHVIAPEFMKDLLNDIGDSFYSLIIDESTNIANIACLGLCIRYYSEKNE